MSKMKNRIALLKNISGTVNYHTMRDKQEPEMQLSHFLSHVEPRIYIYTHIDGMKMEEEHWQKNRTRGRNEGRLSPGKAYSSSTVCGANL